MIRGDVMSHDKKKKEIKEFYDYLSHAASLQDCTGLIPANPNSDAALESYKQTYDYAVKIKNKK